ncbi:MAG: hypothetical protein KAI47_04620 [Deltaproteobacteria bacterium]|nr:hypothetical protein [Deltaproteobacteria bacterium]
MSTRLASMMVSLHHEEPLRLLVPHQTASGRVEYRIETCRVRLPLHRSDRERFQRRIGLRDDD